MRKMTQADQDTLERMIDDCGLTAVVDSVVEICYEKSQHIIDNYQDRRLATQ
jgi:hypothetical protein